MSSLVLNTNIVPGTGVKFEVSPVESLRGSFGLNNIMDKGTHIAVPDSATADASVGAFEKTPTAVRNVGAPCHEPVVTLMYFAVRSCSAGSFASKSARVS